MSWATQAKKLVSVSATFASVTWTIKKAEKVIVLDRMPCIRYSVQFWKDQGATIWALINSGSKVNAKLRLILNN